MWGNTRESSKSLHRTTGLIFPSYFTTDEDFRDADAPNWSLLCQTLDQVFLRVINCLDT